MHGGVRAAGHVLGLSLWLLGCGTEQTEAVPAAGTGRVTRSCEDDAELIDPVDQEAPEVECPKGSVEHYECLGHWAVHCDADGELLSLRNCLSEDLQCAPSGCEGDDCPGGCLPCAPGAARCSADGDLRLCDPEGQRYEPAKTCDTAAGLWCEPEGNTCADLCARAEARRSYLGCEYWAVPTINAALERQFDLNGESCGPFAYAVVMANGHAFAAHVTVSLGGELVTELDIPGDEVQAVELPCVPELAGSGNFTPSALVAAGAYHIRSSIPITAYQFNPLEFEEESAAGATYSYSNDASLLLPVHSLTPNYTVMSRPTMFNLFEDPGGETTPGANPGFVAVIGVDATPTEVEIRSSAYTRATADGRLSPLSPGDTATVTLAQGEVLQLLTATPSKCEEVASDAQRGGRIHYCRVPNTYDLTGTTLRASAPIGVVAGHDCAFVPPNRWACDHLEETMFPQETWGKELLVGQPHPASCAAEPPELVRILSGADGNAVDFDPPIHDPVHLDAGEWLEFETRADFRVTGSGPLLVGQFIVGQDWQGFGSAGSFAESDPAMAITIPREQWRTSYVFLVPETFPRNFISLTAQEHQTVVLDGTLLLGFAPIGDTGMAVMRSGVGPGQHRIESDSPFALMVYGYATYTSYMVPGGMDSTVLQEVD